MQFSGNMVSFVLNEPHTAKMSFSGILKFFFEKLTEKFSFAQNYPHTTKLRFSDVFVHLRVNDMKTSLLFKMCHIQLN